MRASRELAASHPLTRQAIVGVAVGGAVVGASAVVGRALVLGQLHLVLLVLAAVGGLLLFERLSLVGWCTILLLATVVSRGVTELVGLPGILKFAHYPAALAFGLAAAARPRPSQLTPARGAGRWLIGLLFVTAVSLASTRSHPLRALVFLVILGEPLLVVWAILRWGDDMAAPRRVLRLGAALLALQIPIGVFQGLTQGWADPVQGTLLGHLVGSHVVGGLFALGALTVMAAVLDRRIHVMTGVVAVTVATAMMIATEARQVILSACLSLVLMSLLTRRRLPALLGTPPHPPATTAGTPVAPRVRSRAVASALALVLAASVVWLTTTYHPELIARVVKLVAHDERAEVRLVRERAHTDSRALLFGSGPGTGASRASLVLTPELAEGAGRGPERSPLASLDLPPTELALWLASLSRDPWGGSAEGYASTALAILGDLGILGFAALVALYVALWQRAGRARNWLAPAVRGALIMTAVLMFVDNWLEYPEFAVPLAILVGLALSDRTGEQP